MQGKKNERLVCDVPAVLIHRRWGGPRYLIVEYDLWKTSEQVSEDAFEQLGRFVDCYYKVNVPPPSPGQTQPQSGLGLTAGYIHVFREHAADIAVRVLAFITNPVNHHRPRAPLLAETIAIADELAVERDQPTHEQWVDAIRQRVTLECPELVADPLGSIPGTETEPQSSA